MSDRQERTITPAEFQAPGTLPSRNYVRVRAWHLHGSTTVRCETRTICARGLFSVSDMQISAIRGRVYNHEQDNIQDGGHVYVDNDGNLHPPSGQDAIPYPGDNQTSKGAFAEKFRKERDIQYSFYFRAEKDSQEVIGAWGGEAAACADDPNDGYTKQWLIIWIQEAASGAWFEAGRIHFKGITADHTGPNCT